MSRDKEPLKVRTHGTDTLLSGMASDLVYGTDLATSPVITVDDPNAAVLGVMSDSQRTGLAVMRMRGWTSLYSAAPMLPTTLLRNLALASGVHVYTQGDEVVWANRSMLAVNVNNGGPRTISLPRKATVTELFSGKLIDRNTDRFTVDFADKATLLFHLG